jgi:hypothetical protein
MLSYMSNLLTEFTMNEMMNINESPEDLNKRDKIQNSCFENHQK